VSGTPVPDAAARRAALDPSRSFLVEAPAGSGKTTLLTQRYLTLLAGARRPEAVLAITFTRKAAGEMRERALEALTASAQGQAPRDAAEAETFAIAARVLAADALHEWQLLEHPTRLRILTIDALNQWLAARLPVLSRAGSSLAISERPRELYAEAARRLLAEVDSGGALAGDLAVVLEHLDNEVERFEQLLAAMLASRDRWLRHVLAPGGAPDARVRATLEDALAVLVAAALERAAAHLPAALGRRLAPLAVAAARRRATEADAPADAARLAALVAAGGAPATDVAALPAWQALAMLLVTKQGGFRRTVTKREGFPTTAAAEKQAFLALLAELAAVPGAAAALAALPSLPPPRYSDAQWRVLVALHRVLVECAARLGELFAERGVVDFAAVQQAALAALGSPDEPSDLTLELDYRLEHILVDEFQDTSAAQVRLLELLTAGWQPGDGRTLFLVGDPMQSIYAFREADVGLFLGVQRGGLGGVPLEPLTLVANFRSRPALVAWVNATFPQVLAEVADVARGAVPYSPSGAVRAADPAAAVELVMLEDASPAAEAERIAALIAAERARDPQARIAVLGRARTALVAVAAALRARGVAYQGVELVPLAERAAVRDLIALTRALCHRADRIAWLACLRAPWCGLGLERLWQLAGDDAESAILDLAREPARRARLAAADRERLERTLAILEAALADRGRRPLADLVEATWIALGGPATLADAADLANADAFLARLDALESGGDLDDPPALDAALEDLYAAPEAGADEHVQLMTVHRAKGLEWDVVLLAGLGRRTRGRDERLLQWLEFATDGGDSRLVLVPRRARAEASDPLESWLGGLLGEREALELGRLLYVATTRARERLYLVAHLERGADGALRDPERTTLLAALWPAVAVAATAALQPAAAAAAAVAESGPLLRLAAGWTAPPPPPAAVVLSDPPRAAGPSEFEFEWVSAAARHVGSVVHAELERAAGMPLAAFAAALPGRTRLWRRALVELGVGDGQLTAAVARVGRALAATLADPRGQWLLAASHAASASELGLSCVLGGRVVAARIDRTFIAADGTRWIVDYKTSQHEGTDLEGFLEQERRRYAPQLELYARLVAARDGAHPIRLGLYFPLHAAWREWAAGT